MINSIAYSNAKAAANKLHNTSTTGSSVRTQESTELLLSSLVLTVPGDVHLETAAVLSDGFCTIRKDGGSDGGTCALLPGWHACSFLFRGQDTGSWLKEREGKLISTALPFYRVANLFRRTLPGDLITS